jgi:hypothetical protein
MSAVKVIIIALLITGIMLTIGCRGYQGHTVNEQSPAYHNGYEDGFMGLPCNADNASRGVVIGFISDEDYYAGYRDGKESAK